MIKEPTFNLLLFNIKMKLSIMLHISRKHDQNGFSSAFKPVPIKN